MHLVSSYSPMFACAFSFMNTGSLIRQIRPTDDGNHQEDEDPSYEDVPKGDNDEGKS
jgi:hypothetical protein